MLLLCFFRLPANIWPLVDYNHYTKLVSRDKTLRLWDVKSGEEIKQLKVNDEYINSVTFPPSGKCLASGRGFA